MTHNNVFLIILALLSTFSAAASENAEPSKIDIGLSIVKKGSIGGLGCMGLLCLSKKYHGSSISKDDLLLAGGIGFVAFASGATAMAFKDRGEKIPNSPLNNPVPINQSPCPITFYIKAVNAKHKLFDNQKTLTEKE